MRRYWTTVEIRRLREVYPNAENGAIGAQFGRTWSAIQNMANKLGLSKSAQFLAGPYCRFQAGHKTWNAGKHWSPIGSRKTQFKKGQRGARQRPVGAERVCRDGVEVKIAEPNVWCSKARIVWEKHNGPIPAGAIVRLKDGDWSNCKPANLLLITRAVHARMNYRPRKPKAPPRWILPLA